MRLIDADEFRELIDGGYDLNFDDVPNTKKELLRMIDDAPTVDAVQVVRCEDCVHYHKADRGHPDTDWCKRLICGTVKSDFFCADGERRSE